VPDDFRLIEYLLIFALAGGVTGFLSGWFGIGGGIVRVPIFISIFPAFGIHGEIEFKVAAATSLALAVPTGILALRKHVKLGNFKADEFLVWGCGVALGVVIGVALTPYTSPFVLKLLFLGFLILSALYFGLVPDRWVLMQRPPRGAAAFSMGAGIGTYVSMIGIAGGSFATPIMKACACPLPRALAVGAGTSLTVSFLGSIGGVYNGWGIEGRPAWSFGYIDMLIFLVMLPGILLTVSSGVALATRMEKSRLKLAYTIFLMLTIGVMIYHLVAPATPVAGH